MNNTFEKTAEMPDSALVKSALTLVETVSPRFLFTHCARSFLFADAFGKRDGLKYERELLCVSTLLHDLGLTDEYTGKNRFEVDGADAAKAFVAKHGLSEEKAEVVWDAVALHTSSSLALHKQPEIALTALGVGADIAGMRVSDLPPGAVEQITAEYPRLGFNQAIIALLVENLRKKPQVAAATWMADVARAYFPGGCLSDFYANCGEQSI